MLCFGCCLTCRVSVASFFCPCTYFLYINVRYFISSRKPDSKGFDLLFLNRFSFGGLFLALVSFRTVPPLTWSQRPPPWTAYPPSPLCWPLASSSGPAGGADDFLSTISHIQFPPNFQFVSGFFFHTDIPVNRNTSEIDFFHTVPRSLRTEFHFFGGGEPEVQASVPPVALKTGGSFFCSFIFYFLESIQLMVILRTEAIEKMLRATKGIFRPWFSPISRLYSQKRHPMNSFRECLGSYFMLIKPQTSVPVCHIFHDEY